MLVFALAIGLLAACTSAKPTLPTSLLPSPLPTKGSHVNLLCGFVSRASVELALGRSDFTVEGSLTPARSPNPDGTKFSHARCAVSAPDGGQSPALDITVEPFVAGGQDEGIIREARSGCAAFTYPPQIGVGFVNHDLYTDGTGRQHTSAESALLRGDWKLTLGIQIPAKGRDALSDVVGLAQEIVDELRLPLKPTTPYPDASFGPAASCRISGSQ